MSKTAISVIDLGKKYRIGERIKYDTLRDHIGRLTSKAYRKILSPVKRNHDNTNNIDTAGNRHKTKSYNRGVPNFIWPLRNISFEVKHGEIIGIIGRNGAGKSTLLKIISGITEPTEGRVDIHGRIGSLLEVGTGFHPELTGRENIFLNGAILGMKKVEIERKFDEIVDFSGVEQFIDTPVKFYSSGMRVRLGFSVAAHLEPEILLLDEVLAVGDAAFQNKCLGKLDNIATSEGRTVIFISHDLAAVQRLCRRTILLEDGNVAVDGPTGRVVDQYLKSMNTLIKDMPLEDRTDLDKCSDGSIIATFLKIENLEKGRPIRPSSQIVFKVGYRSFVPIKDLIISFKIKDYNTGQPITFLDSDNSKSIPRKLPSEGTLVCITQKLHFTPGKCLVDIYFTIGTKTIYKLESAGHFTVEDEILFGTEIVTRNFGMFLLEHDWSFEADKQ